jgi:hypothetical protein
MQVNVKAVSDALDDLLGETKLGYQTTPNWHNPAIIQKRRQPFSRHPVASEAQSKEQKQINVPAPATKFPSAISGGAYCNNTSTSTPFSEKRLERAKQNTSSHSSLKEVSETTDVFLSAPAKSKATQRSVHLSQKRSDGEKNLYRSFNEIDITASFLNQLKEAEIVAVKPVESSGVGIGAVLITPRNATKRIEKAQLPSKSWVTNTLLASSAYTVLELEDFGNLHQTQVSPLTGQRPSEALPEIAYSVAFRDLKVAIYIDNASEVREKGSVKNTHSPSDGLSFSVMVETSNSRYRGFGVTCEEVFSSSHFVSLTVPGTLLKQFTRVTIKPSDGDNTVKLIRVRAFCVFWSDTWTSETLKQTQLPKSLEKEVEAAPAEYSHKLEDTPSIKIVKGASKKVLQNESSVSENTVPDNQQQHISDCGVLPEKQLAVSQGAASVADFVRSVALTNLRENAALAPERNGETMRAKSAWEYNWLSDELELCPLKSKDLLQALSNEGKASDEKRNTDVPVASALFEYIATLQAWNSVASWSIADALEFCMAQTTSFSASIISSTDLFTESAAAHFAQPFKLHILVTASPHLEKGSKKTVMPAEAAPPPLHNILAIASHAAAMGFTSELLFKCELCGSFGCALRPEDLTLRHREERCKLLFVVPASHESAQLPEAADMLALLLKKSLSVFLTSQRTRHDVEKQIPGHFISQLPRVRPSQPPCGVLRMVIDGMRSFERLAPIIAEWSDIAGPIRYYSDALQPILRALLTPMHLTGLKSTAFSELSQGNYNSEVQWSRLNIKLKGLWKSGSASEEADSTVTVALELRTQLSLSYAWQSVSRERASLRLLLTDHHLLESMYAVDGLILPPLVSDLIQQYSICSNGGKAVLPHIAAYSEEPWVGLLQTAVKLRENMLITSSAAARDAVASFSALRHRVTTTFAFHILSTAFKRGWERVAVSMPVTCSRFYSLATEKGGIEVPASRHAFFVECFSKIGFSFLDEDAFMDTFVQWSYPFPKIVILHCTTVFHCVPLPTSIDEVAVPPMSGTPGNSVCVTSLFSRETLSRFASTESLEEALT